MSHTVLSGASLRRFRALLVAYLLHLCVPLLLLCDVLGAPQTQFSSRTPELVVGVASGIWLASGVACLLLSRDRRRFLARVSKPLLATYCLYAVVAVPEPLRLVLWKEPVFWPPGMKRSMAADPEIMPGIEGVSTFTVNELGLRGPPFPTEERAYKIIAVGGSTTECLYLDDSEEWPHLLMQAMNEAQKARPVWVANAGMSGRSTADHLISLRRAPVLARADVLIFLVGYNDLQAALAFGGSPSQEELERWASGNQDPYFKRLWIYQLLQRAARLAGAVRRHDWDFYLDLRRRRQSSSIVPLPHLDVGLSEYRERVRRIIGECRRRGVRCLFATQPVIYSDRLSQRERSLAWGGWVGGQSSISGYVSVEDLALALDRYNQTLRSVCADAGIECVDLARMVPKTVEAFYDDCHFNESGARTVAKALAAYLLAAPPFGGREE